MDITTTPGYQLWEARLAARVAAELAEACRANMRRRGHHATAARLYGPIAPEAFDILAERMRDDQAVTTAHQRYTEALRAVSDAANRLAEETGVSLDRLLPVDGRTPAA